MSIKTPTPTILGVKPGVTGNNPTTNSLSNDKENMRSWGFTYCRMLLIMLLECYVIGK
jgi:hypothetical protein